MKMKKALCGILALSLLAGLTSCASSSKSSSSSSGTSSSSSQDGEGITKAVTLDVYTNYGDDGSKQLADYAAQQIKKTYPKLSFTFENLPADDQTIKTRAATGNLPDLITLNSGDISVLSKSKSIIPLDSYFTEFNYKAKLQPAVINSCLVSPDGHEYEFPTGGISPILWYYNAQIFQQYNIKVPTDFDELMTAIKQLKANGIIPMAMFAKEPWPLAAYYDSFALQNNNAGMYALSTGDAKASDAGYAEATDKVEQTIKAGVFQAGADNTDFDTASALFTSGKAAMLIDGSWYAGESFTDLKGHGDVMTTYPTGDPGKTTNQYAMTGGGDTNGVAVSANTKDKDFAAKIASLFAYNREVAEYEQQQLITTPYLTTGLKTDKPLNPVLVKLQKALPNYTYHSKSVQNFPNTAFAATFSEELQKLVVGESTSDFTKNVDNSIASTVKK